MKTLGDSLTFPCNFTIKIVGENSKSFTEDTVASIAKLLSASISDIPIATKESSGGKYLSISINPRFSSADQIYAVYDVMSKDPRVKFVV